MGEPLIASFVVRIFGDVDAAADQTAWRVTVRHVQTGEECQFARLADAIAFMDEYACRRDESGDQSTRTDLGGIGK